MSDDAESARPPGPAAQAPLPPAVAFDRGSEGHLIPPQPSYAAPDLTRSQGEEREQMDERMRILKMVEEGKISPSEGAQLLAAMGEDASAAERPMANSGDGRWLKVRVTDSYTGRSKVNVTLPLGIVNAALRVGARFVPDDRREVVNEITDAMSGGMTGKIVDVLDSEDGDHVEIYIE